MTDSTLKDIILNTDKPIVLKEFKLSWNCFNLTFDNWCSLFDAENEQGVKCDIGTWNHGECPQWERYRKSQTRKLSEIINDKENKANWTSFSYRDLNELPAACRDGINFNDFGFPNLVDISFWIGSKGAHTPCHYDSHGCNIIVQVYGRKSWLLFPPDVQLTATRIPYEETSVYCKENFFSPFNLTQFKEVENHVFHVVLEPGDILIVPRKWWHYVENIEPALAINTWIPLDCDTESQIDECIVKMQISNLTENLSDNLKSLLINPNEILALYRLTPNYYTELLQYLSSAHNSNTKKIKLNQHKYAYLSKKEFNDRISYCNVSIEPVKNISSDDFYQIVKDNSKRYTKDSTSNTDNLSSNYQHMSAVINAFCNPNVIKLIRMNYINEQKNQNKKVEENL